MNKTIMETYKDFWRNALVMKGRTRRRDYWIPTLINIVISAILMFIGDMLDHSADVKVDPDSLSFKDMFGMGDILSGIFSLIILIPAVTLLARRLQDRDVDGKWSIIYNAATYILLFLMMIAVSTEMIGFAVILMILSFVIGICGFVILVMTFMDGNPYTNKYGEDPKGRK